MKANSTANKTQEPTSIVCGMGLVASSKDSLTEASAGLEACRGDTMSHAFREKNDLISLAQHNYEGTYGNIRNWALFSGQQGIIASRGYDIYALV